MVGYTSNEPSTVLNLPIISYVTFGDLSKIITFIISNHLTCIHILAGVAILMLVLSYLIMRNGPLERGTTAGFTMRKHSTD